METRIFRHECVDSSSERAFAALADGSARHFDVHVAREQTAGRGRLGRAWHSAPGDGLYLSLVLLPRAPFSAAGLTMALGLAALDAVHAVGLPDAHLKWPNDVVVRRDGDARAEKLCGVLVETRGLDPSAPHYVAGIGINVRQRAFPVELTTERLVTSLSLCDVDTTCDACERALLDALHARIGQLEAAPDVLLADFARATTLAGRMVRATIGDARVEGVWEGLDAQRGLRVRTADGALRELALEHVRALEAPER